MTPEQAGAVAERAHARGAQQKIMELARLVEQVAALRPRTVVEIGTAQGGSFGAWCEASAPDAMLVSIDQPGGMFGGGYTEDDWRRISGYARAGQAAYSLRADSHEPETRQRLLNRLAGRPVDFLFIDGDHTHDGVAQDYWMYAPLVRPGGLVALHDIVRHPAMPACQVDQFYAAIRHTHPQRCEYVDAAGGEWGGIAALTQEPTHARMREMTTA